MQPYEPQYQGSPNPVALIGVHLAKKGLSGAFACDLKRISRKRAQFRALTTGFKADYGVDFELTATSTGKEPCVLAKFDDGSTAMLLDSRDLALVDGNVKKFEQNLRAKMMFFF
jgi:hypothetical protein